jgi:hypothetical protein
MHGIFIVTHSTNNVCRYAAPTTSTANQRDGPRTRALTGARGDRIVKGLPNLLGNTSPRSRSAALLSTITLLGMTDRYEYKVIQLREGLLGGKMSGDKLEEGTQRTCLAGMAVEGDHCGGGEGKGWARRGRGRAGDLRASVAR